MNNDVHPDVESVFADAPIRPFHLSVLALSFLIVLIDGFDTQAVALVAPDIARQWHTPPAAFGVVFSTALIGAVIGAALFTIAADRFGRKIPLIIAVGLFGLVSLLTPLTWSLESLTAARFVTGLGLGGAWPILLATVSDYGPSRSRTLTTGLATCGFPVGATCAGLFTPLLLGPLGWQGVFVVGGILPLVLIPVIALVLPESARFLIARDRRAALDRVMRRVGREDLVGQPLRARPVPRRLPVSGLFTEGRTAGTLLLWLTLFFSLLLAYFLNSWITTVARANGFDAGTAILGAAALNLGGVLGVVLLGPWLGRRRRPAATIGVCYVLGAVFVTLIGQVHASGPLLLAVILVAGVFTIGAQLCTMPMIASFYRVEERATGFGWSMGVGRAGGIIGPALGGVLVAAGFTMSSLFFVGGLFALGASVAIVLFGRFGLRESAGQRLAPSLS
ncbi:MFS transporter [Kutzneria sp. NPDC052558]|uniref:MFS transporter n=1 Tax=Kutzneria sp. NPDC052558 TaxID=3364121 RepID=UPI0037C55743